VGLPDLDGYEVAKLIRARFGTKIRLVALTGYSGTEARKEASRVGFDVFITKPCSSAELERALSP
jgi:CheY-like chemotaxis protein